jgi:hypothetical protein
MATDRHSEHVILFPLHQRLPEHVSPLRYVYGRCLLDVTQTDRIVRSVDSEYIQCVVTSTFGRHPTRF